MIKVFTSLSIETCRKFIGTLHLRMISFKYVKNLSSIDAARVECEITRHPYLKWPANVELLIVYFKIWRK